MRQKKALYNTITSLSLQIVTLISGLIIPRLILSRFGSNVNGLISSVTQFLGYIVLLEAGVGGVVRASLYKPLSKGDYYSVSRILKSAELFFRKIAFIFVVYLAFVSILYPFIVKGDFEYWYTSTLVIIIGLTTFIEYYFGITYQLLLYSDQRKYLINLIQIGTYFINIVTVVILIKSNLSIHVIKFASSLIFIARPLILRLIVKTKYPLVQDCEPDNDAVKQRWDGFGHHIAFFLHTHTDVVVLTVFTNVKLVSVYSVYYMIVGKIKQLVTPFLSGIEATFGDMIAKNEIATLKKYFRIYEYITFIITFILFTCTALLILPFVSIYTKGITDINYIRPLFAYLLTISEAIYCIRIPYHTVTIAAGHFRQTRIGAYVEVCINILLSLILINYFDLVGVVIGTLIAMLFRTVYYVIYLSRNILHLNVLEFIKRFIINGMCVLLVILINSILPNWQVNTYSRWILYAMLITIISSFIIVVINSIFYRKDMKEFLGIVRNLIKLSIKKEKTS